MLGKPINPHLYGFRIYWTWLWLQKTNAIYSRRHQNTLNKSRTNPKSLKKMLLWEIPNKILGNSNILRVWEQTGSDQSQRSVDLFFDNLAYEIKIYPKTWDGSLATGHQYLSKNMRWTFGNFSPRNFNHWHIFCPATWTQQNWKEKDF